jgi:uncharacterized membrane protein YebE (DUF533 family)
LGGEQQADGSIGVGAQNKQLLQKAQQIVRSTPINQFLAQAAPILSDAQKMCILTNLLDSLMADGNIEQSEQQMFSGFLQAFGIDENRFKPFFEVITLKNDRTVFTNLSHPHNQPGFQVKLTV